MSKKNSDGDVLANRLSLGLAKHQKLLASWMGSQPDTQLANDTSKNEDEDSELKQDFYGHDRLGVGGILPKDDGNFLKRKATTNDKLLEQLIGKKKAKAHIAAKEQAERLGAQSQPKHDRREVQKKEESDDEEEGRAATFKSKRRKVARPKLAPVSDEEDRPEDDAATTKPSEEDTSKPTISNEPSEDREQDQEPENASLPKENEEPDQPVPVSNKPKSMPSRTRAKPTSYLDELLAERSKKKKNKAKNKTAEEN